MANSVTGAAGTTITLDPIYITARGPAPADKAKPAAPQPAQVPGDGFDRGPTARAKLESFSSGERYTPAPAIGDVTQGTRNLHRGQKGESVELAQKLLTDAGFGPLTADGKFGPKTDAAVRAYQASAGLKVDGKVGIDTMRSLNAGNSTSIQKADGFAELSAPVQADLKARYDGAAHDIRHRQALASLVEDLHRLPPELQTKALDAAARPGSNFPLMDAVGDFVLGMSDAATLGRKLDGMIGR